MVGFTKSNVEPTLKVKFFSAGLAACVGDLITFPLDTSKVRLQVGRHVNLYMKDKFWSFLKESFCDMLVLLNCAQGLHV